ncbi:hypothetical protein QBC35DRAFT_347446, partial [Podospora australis]
DRRDVEGIWVKAIHDYKGIMGFELTHKYDSVQDMIDAATSELNRFHTWRHNQGKVDRIRTLFAENLDYIEKGSRQLLKAAEVSFPPASAIGTALTYLLRESKRTMGTQACRKQSADYNVIEAFFEDMQSFLERTIIIQSRVTPNQGWERCLMDVFTAFLVMIEIHELSAARSKLITKLERPQDATSLAILGNTEDLSKMNRDLKGNQKLHKQRLGVQTGILKKIMASNIAISDGMHTLLKAMDDARNRVEIEGSLNRAGNDIGRGGIKKQTSISASLIRNALPNVDDGASEYQNAKEGLVNDPCCRWVFSHPAWGPWVQAKQTPRAPLAIMDPAGIGKTRLAVVIYDELVTSHGKDDRTAVTHFYFRQHRPDLSVF